jgi:pSer/pThr/pTyr-binding forkhead associated (FHA) protein
MLKLQLQGKTEKSVWLVGEQVTIGSAEGNDVVLADLGVEPQHAAILISGEQLSLRPIAGDCYINGMVALGESPLKCNDELRMGLQHINIVDPKQLEKKVDGGNTVAPKASQVSQWALRAKHPQLQGRLYTIEGSAILGRDKACDIVLPSKLLSRKHAELTVEQGRLWVRDLGSSNGSYVNGKGVEKAVLVDGDTVSFAKIGFQVLAPDEQGDADKTMVRPAIDMDGLAAKKTGELSIGGGDLSEPSAVAPKNLDVELSEPKRGLDVGLLSSVVAVILAVAGVWLYISRV